MTKGKKHKKRVREHMGKTGLRYTEAKDDLETEEEPEVPPEVLEEHLRHFESMKVDAEEAIQIRSLVESAEFRLWAHKIPTANVSRWFKKHVGREQLEAIVMIAVEKDVRAVVASKRWAEKFDHPGIVVANIPDRDVFMFLEDYDLSDPMTMVRVVVDVEMPIACVWNGSTYLANRVVAEGEPGYLHRNRLSEEELMKWYDIRKTYVQAPNDPLTKRLEQMRSEQPAPVEDDIFDVTNPKHVADHLRYFGSEMDLGGFVNDLYEPQIGPDPKMFEHFHEWHEALEEASTRGSLIAVSDPRRRIVGYRSSDGDLCIGVSQVKEAPDDLQEYLRTPERRLAYGLELCGQRVEDVKSDDEFSVRDLVKIW